MRNCSLSNLVDFQGIGPFQASGSGSLRRHRRTPQKVDGRVGALEGGSCEVGRGSCGALGQKGWQGCLGTGRRGASLLSPERLLTAPRNSLGTPPLPCPSGTQETGCGAGEGGGAEPGGAEGRKEAAFCSAVTFLWGDRSPGLAEKEPRKVGQAEPAGPVCTHLLLRLPSTPCKAENSHTLILWGRPANERLEMLTQPHAQLRLPCQAIKLAAMEAGQRRA